MVTKKMRCRIGPRSTLNSKAQAHFSRTSVVRFLSNVLLKILTVLCAVSLPYFISKSWWKSSGFIRKVLVPKAIPAPQTLNKVLATLNMTTEEIQHAPVHLTLPRWGESRSSQFPSRSEGLETSTLAPHHVIYNDSNPISCSLLESGNVSLPDIHGKLLCRLRFTDLFHRVSQFLQCAGK